MGSDLFRTRTKSAIATAINAQRFAAVDTEQDVLDWIAATGGGASGERPRWPGIATTGGGLAALHPQANWSFGFGRDSALPAPIMAATLPHWDNLNKRLFYRSFTDPQYYTLEDLFVPGNIDLTAWDAPITARNCVFDGEYVRFLAVSQMASPVHPILFERCEFLQQISVPVPINHGTIKDCYAHTSKSDAYRFGGSGPKMLIRSMARKLGQLDPVTHADCVQTSPGGASDITTFGNMLYMPYTGGPYDEATYGTTNVLNYTTSSGDLSDIISVNDCLIGGGYTVALFPTANYIINGAAMIGSWFSKPGEGFTQYGSFYPGQTTIGLTKNILIHNCRYLEDGSPVKHAEWNFGGTDAQGLWEYDKSIAPARFKQICQMLGYTDWNDDPLVTVRTGFHFGTVV